MTAYKTDCFFFKNDVPCSWHKNNGVTCADCEYYEGIRGRILIIKLDAIGDVMRTTFILPALKRAYPASHITWITRANALQVLENNPLINEAIAYESPDCQLCLATTDFDLCLSLDPSPVSAKIAYLARAREKRGFVWEQTAVRPTNAGAMRWFDMGLSDALKKDNTDYYQSIFKKILGLEIPEAEYKPVFALKKVEMEAATAWASKKGISAENLVVGFNVGAGGRWPLKRWRADGFFDLISKILPAYPSLECLLLGGPEEEQIIKGLVDRFSSSRVVSSGTRNSIREFAAIVDLCDVVVTGDTLGLHIALALDKYVIGVFGPTSAPEIYAARGEKIVSPIECACCYKKNCDMKTNCMDLITTDRMLKAVKDAVAVLEMERGKAPV